MRFFYELGKKTADTTNKIALGAKLKINITENKNRIKNLYEKLGKKVYENHIREENKDFKSIIKEECDEIDFLSKEIENARKEILRIENKIMCKKCYAEIEKDSNFCPKCGEKQNIKKTVFEKAEERIENTNTLPKKEKEEKIVKEELKNKNNK